jgi:hypothetical protein
MSKARLQRDPPGQYFEIPAMTVNTEARIVTPPRHQADRATDRSNLQKKNPGSFLPGFC